MSTFAEGGTLSVALTPDVPIEQLRLALISETAFDSVKDKFPGNRVSEEKVKGREETVVIYSLA